MLTHPDKPNPKQRSFLRLLSAVLLFAGLTAPGTSAASPPIHPVFAEAGADPSNRREAPDWKAAYSNLVEVPLAEALGGGPLDDLDFAGLQLAVERSVAYLSDLSTDRAATIGNRSLTPEQLIRSLGRLQLLLADQARPSLEELEALFVVYRSTPEGSMSKATGYYEPVYSARLERSEAYSWPIYPRPAKARSPEDSREQIVFENSLKGRAEPLAWMANPVDVSILHIQGSAVLELGDGQIGRVNYDGSNGHRFYPIGRALKDVIPRHKMSIGAIRSYLLDHPERWREILSKDASYVFLRRMAEGPMGTIQQAVTAERSIAVDQKEVPLGAPCLIRIPQLRTESAKSSGPSIQRLVMAQDTGGAIKGPGRFDYFRGTGAEAEAKAGPMNEQAELFVLLPR
ncbi:MAG: MltA domain-containing protein [Myxococcota bacterium]|nr:MltA domain-containing protein [Myxococcota bacterium]